MSRLSELPWALQYRYCHAPFLSEPELALVPAFEAGVGRNLAGTVTLLISRRTVPFATSL